MSTLQIVSHPRIVNGTLDVSALTITAIDLALDVRTLEALAIARDGRTLEIDLPEAAALSIRVTGFTTGGTSWKIGATSRLENQASTTWPSEGADALSPRFTAEGIYTLEIIATPNNSTTARMLSTVSMKIRKPGKPDTFLNTNFTPK